MPPTVVVGAETPQMVKRSKMIKVNAKVVTHNNNNRTQVEEEKKLTQKLLQSKQLNSSSRSMPLLSAEKLAVRS